MRECCRCWTGLLDRALTALPSSAPRAAYASVKNAAKDLHLWDTAAAYCSHLSGGGTAVDFTAPDSYNTNETIAKFLERDYPWQAEAGAPASDRLCFRVLEARGTIARRTEERALLLVEATRALAYWTNCIAQLEEEMTALWALHCGPATADAGAMETDEPGAAVPEHDAAAPPDAMAAEQVPADAQEQPVDAPASELVEISDALMMLLPAAARNVLVTPAAGAEDASPAGVDAPAPTAPSVSTASQSTINLCRAVANAKHAALGRYRFTLWNQRCNAARLWARKGLRAGVGRRTKAVDPMGSGILPSNWNTLWEKPPSDVAADVAADPGEMAE